jgi:hypothetical protein
LSRIIRIARCRLIKPSGTMEYRARAKAANRNGYDVMDELTKSVCYEIRVRGLLGGTLSGAFPGLRAQADGAETLLSGPVADQAALYGVLDQIEALGLELVEVRRTPC